MIGRMARVQVIVFAVVAVLGVTYVGASYARLDTLFVDPGYTVRAHLPDSGGIFVNAEVTYRGVPIGRVGQLRLIEGGVEVDLHLEDAEEPVPADVELVVANRSAVGEQYVDLRPRSAGKPYLADGAVIEQDADALPLPVEDLLSNLDKLVASVPTEDLQTVVDELYDATAGTGPELQAVLDSVSDVTEAAVKHMPQTLKLITDAETALTTQIDSTDAIVAFGADVKKLARTLRDGDRDLRKFLSSAPTVAKEVTDFIAESGPGLGSLIANLTTTSTVFLAERDGLETLLVVTPQATATAHRVLSGGSASAALPTTFFSPLPCTYGTKYRNGTDTSSGSFNTNARC